MQRKNRIKTITRFLPFDILSEVLQSDNRHRLIVSGIMDKNKETITFCNGNGEKFTVSFSFFKPNAIVSPNFDKFSISDYGQTIVFGDYEAASDCIIPKVSKQFPGYYEIKDLEWIEYKSNWIAYSIDGNLNLEYDGVRWTFNYCNCEYYDEGTINFDVDVSLEEAKNKVQEWYFDRLKNSLNKVTK